MASISTLTIIITFEMDTTQESFEISIALFSYFRINWFFDFIRVFGAKVLKEYPYQTCREIGELFSSDYEIFLF